jgi:hypothetical protein
MYIKAALAISNLIFILKKLDRPEAYEQHYHSYIAAATIRTAVGMTMEICKFTLVGC